MPVRFRNVDASPTDDVATWPYEALVTVIERGLVADWAPLFAEIRRQPWGPVARRVDHIATTMSDAPAARLFAMAVARARRDAEDAERQRVASRIRAAIESSGLTATAFAALVGTSASRLSTYASGQVVPAATMLDRIERRGAAGQ